MGCKNIITEPREGEYVSVEGLEVEVAPRAAHAAIVSRIGSCELKLAIKKLIKIPSHGESQLVQDFILSLNNFCLPTLPQFVVFWPPIHRKNCVFILHSDLLLILYSPINDYTSFQLHFISANSSISCFITTLLLLFIIYSFTTGFPYLY